MSFLNDPHLAPTDFKKLDANVTPSIEGWTGSVVQIRAPDFDLCNLIRTVTLQQTDDKGDDLVYSCILSTSPLTSCESSQCASPSHTPINVPDPIITLNGASDRLAHLEEKGEVFGGRDHEEEARLDAVDIQGEKTAKRRRKRKRPCSPSLPAYNQSHEHKEASVKRKNDKNKQQSKMNKKKKQRLAADSQFSIPAVIPKIQQKHLRACQEIQTDVNIASSSTTQNAYIARKSAYDANIVYTLDDLVGPSSTFNFRLEKWDGVTPKPLIDSQGRMFGHLAGQGDSNTWKRDAATGAELLENARGQCHFSDEDSHQRPRGPFPILRCGVSHGGGQVQPCNVSHRDTRRNRMVIQQLNRAPAFRRISNFASSVFASWAPRLHRYYVDTAQAIHGKYPDLERPFPRSAFSATTYNMGPSTICVPHTDMANLAYGWCAIVALGDYDPVVGGHLVLWECGLVIEFPPGSLILIPSAIITHSNTPIQPHERRFSFTQYTAGALFRWVEQDFKSQKEFRASKSKVELANIDEELSKRWQEGLALLPRLTNHVNL